MLNKVSIPRFDRIILKIANTWNSNLFQHQNVIIYPLNMGAKQTLYGIDVIPGRYQITSSRILTYVAYRDIQCRVLPCPTITVSL
eukprot:6193949-Pleurochrysis_carterae.AAC.1